MQIFESMSAEEKVLARVYLSALTDKKEYQEATEKKKQRMIRETCAEIRHKEKEEGDRIMTEIEKKEMTQEISDVLARKLLNATQEPEFEYGEKIRTTDVAKLLGKTAGWVQAGIINGWLPIGVATLEGKLVTNQNQIRSNKRVDYTIFPQKLWEVTGIIWKGRDTVNG